MGLEAKVCWIACPLKDPLKVSNERSSEPVRDQGS